MARTKKVKAAGRFRVGYGLRVRKRIREIEELQRKKQLCPFCNSKVKRIAKGLWECKKCGKRFASHTYYLIKHS